MVENLLDLLIFELYITSVRSGGWGFGEKNPSLNPLASGLGHRNPKPIDGSIGSR